LPGAVSLAADGSLQVVALRNAPRERAFHFLPVSGNPAKGFERDDFAFLYALEFTPAGDWKQNKLAEKAFVVNLDPWADPTRTFLNELAEAEIQLDRSDVWVTANKVASRGQGRIVRLYTLASPRRTVTLQSVRRVIKEAYLCDALERDIQRLEVNDGRVPVPMQGTISTVRLICSPA
jgi:alpha-mannosidase